MTVVLDDEEAVRNLKRMAAGQGVSADEIVRRAVLEKACRDTPSLSQTTSYQEIMNAVGDLQAWYAEYRDTRDVRTADEIIGYNERGLFD